MTASRLSRRNLFGLGLGRLLEERLGALDLSGAGSEAPGEPDTDRPARPKEASSIKWWVE